MTYNADRFLGRTFGGPVPCWTLVRDVWLELTGRDIGDLPDLRLVNTILRGRFESDPGWTQLPAPETPCVAMMERLRCVPHVGIYLRGRILQVGASGVTYLPPRVAAAGWDRLSYFK